MDSTTAAFSNAHSVTVKNSAIHTIGGNQYNYHVNSNLNTNDEHQAIANWLSPLNFKASQNEYIQKRENGTGEWLLERQDFKDWRDGTSEILWCPGDAGAGKTILASIVVNHLQTIFGENDRVAIVVMYCNYKEQAEQTVSTLVASLLKQMVQDRRAISNDVKTFYERHRRQSTRPTPDQITNALKSEILTYSRVFVVVDALDECREDDGTRARLLKVLRSLGGIVNLLITSRNLPSIARDFRGTKCLYIRAKDDDIRKYVEGRVSLAPRHLEKLQETIVNRIIDNAKGMFLLARLHMDSLVGKLSTAEVRTALGHLPAGIDETYDDALERIERQDDSRKQLAKRVLSWITCVVRPLSVDELQHALAVVPNTTEIDLEAIIDEEILTSVCVGLVVVDKKQNVIRLVHYTAQQYFERMRKSHFPNTQATIAAICLTYLSFDVFGTSASDTSEERKSLLTNNPFLGYAVEHWGHHAHGHEATVKSLALNFLQDDSKVACASRVLTAQYFWDHRTYSGMHLSSFFGLEKIISYQLENGAMADLADSDGRTPLSIAAENGHEAVVKLLLARDDVDINSKTSDGRTALLFATNNRHETVVRVLLARDDVNVNSIDSDGETPLSMAAKNGQEAVVKLLFARKDVDVNSKNSDGETPLSMAAQDGHKIVVKLLLAWNDVEINSKTSDGETPLSMAAQKGHEAVVKLLVVRDDIDVNSKTLDGETPLSMAAENGHERVVKLLLTRDDIDVNAQNLDGLTPLSHAATYGHKAIVELLLARDDVDVNSNESNGLTPLSMAAKNGCEAVVKLLLLRQDVNVNSNGWDGQTPLLYASRYGHEGVVKLLLARGDVDVNSRTSDGWTPLLFATHNRKDAVVKLLLARDDVNVNSNDPNGETPLSMAAKDGREAVVKMLLARREVDVNPKGWDSRTPLLYAVRYGHEKVMKLLLARDDVDVNSKTWDGWTPLSLATHNRDEAAVKLLLARMESNGGQLST